MCGRYVSPDSAAIERQWRIGRINSNPFPRRFNVAPTTTIPIIRRARNADDLQLTEARWGFVPGWWKKPQPPKHCFNARAEEAATKPIWRDSYARARCLVPAEGWYEWSGAERVDAKTGEIKSYRRPHFIFRADRRLICFAGLMSIWYPDTQSTVLTCAILTRPAAPSVEDVHDRMPVVLEEDAFGKWLDGSVTAAKDVTAIVAGAQSEFQHYPVSTRLNSARDDGDEEFIRPLQMSA